MLPLARRLLDRGEGSSDVMRHESDTELTSRAPSARLSRPSLCVHVHYSSLTQTFEREKPIFQASKHTHNQYNGIIKYQGP